MACIRVPELFTFVLSFAQKAQYIYPVYTKKRVMYRAYTGRPLNCEKMTGIYRNGGVDDHNKVRSLPSVRR